MPSPKYIWKIRRKSDGKYSTGGYDPKFTSIGKTWTSKAFIMNHMNLINDTGYYDGSKQGGERLAVIYKNCEVVGYKIEEYIAYTPEEFVALKGKSIK